jgi:hypothetical protein
MRKAGNRARGGASVFCQHGRVNAAFVSVKTPYFDGLLLKTG